MCDIWITESSSCYSHYEKELICNEYKDAHVEELESTEVFDRIVIEKPDAIILDNRLPFIDGKDLIDRIGELSPETKIIIVSSDRRGIDGLKNSGIMILEKPLKAAQFLMVVGQVYYGG